MTRPDLSTPDALAQAAAEAAQNKGDEMSEQEFLDAVRQARRLGYGRMMQIVSREWYQDDPIGALTPSGPCYGQTSAKQQEMYARAIAADPLFEATEAPQ